jgi:hypothetical protein
MQNPEIGLDLFYIAGVAAATKKWSRSEIAADGVVIKKMLEVSHHPVCAG